MRTNACSLTLLVTIAAIVTLASACLVAALAPLPGLGGPPTRSLTPLEGRNLVASVLSCGLRPSVAKSLGDIGDPGRPSPLLFASRYDESFGMSRAVVVLSEEPTQPQFQVMEYRSQPQFQVTEYRFGWPFRSMVAISLTHYPSGLAGPLTRELFAGVRVGRDISNPRIIPIGIMCLGLILNTLLAFVFLYLLFLAPFTIRRWLRLRRGACTTCGYPLRPSSSSLCPECGATQPLGAAT